MFFIFFKSKVKILALILALVLTALAAIIISFFSMSASGKSSEYIFDLDETGGIGGFLSQFSLEYESLLHQRELIFPSKDDSVFEWYGDFQSELGLNVLKFSGKKVEERYLKLKNKSKKGESLYAVVYLYKNRVIATHLTTLEEDSELLPITAFG